MQIAIEFHCCLCSNSHKTSAELPDGWDRHYDGMDDENQAFCPDHAAVRPFTTFQCAGCVGGWGDCDLWRGFAYKSGRNLTEADFAKLEEGFCPRRTNGTFSMSVGKSGAKMEDINLSDRAPVESGKALAQAIRDYWQRY